MFGSANGQSITGFSRESRRAGLRLDDEIETARIDHDAGIAIARAATVRCRHRSRHRARIEGIEDRDHASGRWENYSAANSRAFRRAAEGIGEIVRQNGGGSAGPRSNKSADGAR